MPGEFVINLDGQFGILKGGEFAIVGEKGIGACSCCAGPLLIWMIIDEDEAAYSGYTNQGHCGCYEPEDTAKLEALYEKYPFLNGTTICNRIDRTSLPNNKARVFATPPGVALRDWPRPPDLEILKSAFLSDIKRFKDTNEQIYFFTIVDNSGSMTTATIQPGWNQFLSWLRNEFQSTDERFVQVHTTSSGFPERWILFIQDAMNEYVEASGSRLRTSVSNLDLKPEAGSQKSMPDFHDLDGWKNYTGPYCKWMIDTGEPAPGECNSHYVECSHPDCPITKSKTRFCNPQNCKFFEL